MMNNFEAVDLVRETLMMALTLCTPLLAVGMIAGLAVGLIQALTQIQDQTVSFVPKLMAMAGMMIVCLPWLLTQMLDFTRSIIIGAGQW